MKWIALLAAAVILLVGAWLLVGPRGASDPKVVVPEIRIPSDPADRPALIKSAKQFIDYAPNPKNVGEGVRLLGFLGACLTEAEWPQAAHDVFVGWQRIHRTPGSQETLEPLSGDLLMRLAPHLGAAQLEALIRSANGNDYYAPRIDAALDRLSKEPVKEFAGSALARLVEASVRAEDFKRATRYLAESRFEAGTPDETRAPAVRLAKILDSYHRAKAGRGDLGGVVEEWTKPGEDKVARPVLLATGAVIARSGKETLDYTALKDAMAKTRSLEGAGKYWAEVIQAFLGSLPKVGQYAQTNTLEALARDYAAAFDNPSFESEFWQKLADQNKEKHIAEVMWRIECL